MFLVLNIGFYNSKIKNDSGRYVYPTKLQTKDDGYRRLIINSTSYEIGVGSRDIGDKQISEVHSMCTEYGILKYSNSEEVNLVVALPMGLYLNRNYRETYQKKLTGLHRGVVDGVQREVLVKDCTVFAEGAASYLPYKSILKDRVVGLLDFGGNTINCMVYDNGLLIKDTISQLDLGMIKLERSIIDAINSAKGWIVQEYEVKEIVKYGECKEIIDRCIYNHLEEIKQRLLEKKWNIDRLTMFATGGGSIELKDYLNSAFNRIIISDTGLWDNVEGLWKVGCKQYGKKAY